MNPVLDQIAVAALITGAVAFFVARFIRSRAGGKACGSDCGCGTSKASKKPTAISR
jgi:hypothetical protein